MRASRRRRWLARPRACAKRLRYIDEHKFAVARAGLTAYKQEKALAGTPLAAVIAKERWTFTRRRACPVAGLRVVAFAPDGDTAFAVSAFERDEEVLELRGGTWHPFRLDGVAPVDIQCARVLLDGRIAIGGRTALAAVAAFGGAVDHWSVRGQVGHVIADLRSTGDGTALRTIFASVDARIVDSELELAFVGQGSGAGIAAVGTQGRLTQHVPNGFGPIAGVACGKVIMIAGKALGVVTDEGIDAAGDADGARRLVPIDRSSALALGRRGFLYFNLLSTSVWTELTVDAKPPLVAATASRTEIYAVDDVGTILRRSASRTWVPLPDGVARALDPIEMWAAEGHIRIICGDGAIVEGRRSV